MKFIDERISWPHWQEFKPTTPWGTVPILTLSDGRVIGQQRAVLRFVGKETGLYPKDNFLAAKADELMDCVEDVNPLTSAAGRGLEMPEKEAARKAECEEGGSIYGLLHKIDDAILKNGSSQGFSVGNELTVADLFIYVGCNNLVGGIWDGVPTDCIDRFVNITQLRKSVRSHPGVSKWYDELDASIKMPPSYNPFIVFCF